MNLLDWLGGQVEGAFAQANPWDNGADYNSVQQRRRKEEQARAQRPPRAPQVGVNAVRPLSVQSTPLPKVSQAQISQRSVANQFNPLKTVGDVAGGIGKGINDVATAVGGFVLPGTAKLTNQTLGIIENTGANIAGETQKLFGDKKGGQNTIDSVKRHVDQNLLGQGKGLFGQGGIYNSTDSLHNANPTEVLKKAGGTGLEVAGELLPVARVAKGPTLGAKIANNAIAGAVSNTLADVGSQYVQNGTVNPWQTAQSAAIGGAFGGAIPVVGAAVKPVGTKLVQTGQRAQNFGLLPPTKLTPEELFAAKKMRQAQQGLIDPRTVTTQDAILNNRAEKKLGQSPGTPQAWHEVNRALDAHRAFNVEVAQRAQAVKDGLTTANDFTKRHLVPGGTLDAPLGKKNKELNTAVDARIYVDNTAADNEIQAIYRRANNARNGKLTITEENRIAELQQSKAKNENAGRSNSTKRVAELANGEIYSMANADISRTKSPGMNQDGFTIGIGQNKAYVSLDKASPETRIQIADAEAEYELARSNSKGPSAPGTETSVTIAKRKVNEAYSRAIEELGLQDYATKVGGDGKITQRVLSARYGDWVYENYKSGKYTDEQIKDMEVNPQKYRDQFESESKQSTPPLDTKQYVKDMSKAQKAVDNSSIDKRLVEAAKRERVVDFDPATNEDALKMFNVVNDDILKQIKSAKSYDDFVKQATKGLDPSSVNARMASIDRMAQSRIGMSVKDIYEMVSGRSGKAMSIDPTANKQNVNSYAKANKELRTAIDSRIHETNPELFHTEATGRTLSETGEGIPRIHVDDLKRYFGHTEDIPATYKRTTGRADLDELAREAGFDDVDNYVEAIQQELGTRTGGRENAQLLRDLRSDPTIIEEARQSLADEKARYGTPDTFEPSARDLREADKMNRPQVESTSRRVERALDPNDKLAYKNLSPLEKKLYQGEKAKQRLAKTQAMKQGTAVESQTQSKVPEKGNTASPKTSRGQQKVSSPSVVRLSDKSRTPLEVRGQNSKEIRSQIKSALNNSSAKERGFIETIINDPHTAQHIKDNVTSLYNVRNTKDLQIRAKNLVKDSPDLAQRVAEAGNGDVSVAVGSELLKHLQKNGNYETALDLADKLAKQGTEAGRTAQAFSIYGKLTPSGVLRFAQRTIKQYNDANNLAPGKQLKLTPQQAKSLTDKSTALWKMPEGRAKDIATKELVGEIYKLVPSSWAAKISTGQTMAQLLNPKTAIRNVLGNTLFGGVDNISQVLASGIDKATSKVRGSARTTALPSAKAQLGGLKSGAKQAIEEINKGVNLGPNTQFELGDVPTFRGGIMGGLEKTMSYELRVPDRAAYQAAFDDTVHGLMKANKLDKPTAEILEQANANGLYKTFQDNSTAAKLFVKSKEALNHVGIEGKDGKRFGLGDLLLKYPKTPGNILARGLDYSPVGIVKGLTQIVKPAITGKPFNQHTFANSIARGTVGTGAIIGAGAVLGGLGIITEAPNEDTDARNLQKASGQGGYQINVDALRRYLFSGFDSDEAKLKEGDTLVSYDWAQPMSIPLSAGAAIGKKQNPGDAAISTVSNAANGLNTLIEQPLVSGLNTFFNNVKNKGVVGAAGETAKGAPASFVPTASNQTRQLTDNTTRSTYDPNGFGLVQSLNMVANKIPGASYLLHPQVDTLGNDKQNYQNGSNNLLNVAFNPAFVNKYQPDSAAKLPLGIMNDTGETKQIPTTTKTTQKVNGENMQLTAQQNEDFQRYVGLKTRDYLETASKDKQFMSLNQQDQATRISQAISNIQQAARVQVLGGNSDNADKNVKNILTTGAATLNTKAVSSGVSSVDINDKIASEYKDTLNKYSSDDDRKKWFNSENDAEYKYNLAKYENAKANGTLSTADDIRTKRSVYKDKVGSSYSKNVREMYTLSKTELADYLNTEDGTDKAKLYDELYAYDRALYDAGLVSSLKFKYGFASGSKSGKKGGKKGNGVTEGKAMVSLARQLNKLTTPKTTGSKSPAAGIKLPQLKKTALRKYTVKTAKVQKAAKPLKIKTSKA